MRDVAEGLWYIHSKGIVHGNLCGVRILILVCQCLLHLCIRKIYFLTPLSAVKFLVLNWHEILHLLHHRC